MATDSVGNIVARTDTFTSTMFRLGEGKTERAVMRSLIAELAIKGWQSVPTGGKWHDYRIYYVGPDRVSIPADMPKSGGLSPTVMWAWTVAIAIFLFVVCVVLVFSTEVRFTAGLIY